MLATSHALQSIENNDTQLSVTANCKNNQKANHTLSDGDDDVLKMMLQWNCLEDILSLSQIIW